MARRAEWRIPNSTASPARWRATGVLPYETYLLGYGGLMLAISAAVAGAWALAVIGVALMPTWFALHRRFHRPWVTIAPDPLPPDSYPVVVVLRWREQPTGSDEGLLSLIDGWLHFEGRHTAFNFRSSEARLDATPSSSRSPFAPTEPEPWVVFLLPDDQQLRIYPAPGRSSIEDLRTALRRWTAEAHEPEGASLLPPLAPHLGHSDYTRNSIRFSIAIVVAQALAVALGATPYLLVVAAFVVSIIVTATRQQTRLERLVHALPLQENGPQRLADVTPEKR